MNIPDDEQQACNAQVAGRQDRYGSVSTWTFRETS